MALQSPFVPQGNTVALTVTTTAHAPVKVRGDGNSIHYMVANAGPNTAFICADQSNPDGTAPTLAAVIPTDGTPANGIPVLASTRQTFTFQSDCWISAICAATQSATLYVTPGEGKI